ncbi:MAG: cytidylate kinase-like family protein [Lachnospiraceae bacterium]
MYRVIAMERQFASGGNEIGRRLAKQLGYQIYDRTILIEAAKKLEIPLRYIENLEETSPGSIIFNLSQTSLGGSKKLDKDMPLADRLFYEEKRIIEEAVEKGNCIIIGRCAGAILQDRSDCLSVFIHADKSFRLKRAVEAEHIAQADAENMLKKVDKRRSSFYTRHTGLPWGQQDTFEICLDSGRLGLDTCVELLAHTAHL